MPEVSKETIAAVATHLNTELQSLREDTEGTDQIITETKQAAKELLEAVKKNDYQEERKKKRAVSGKVCTFAAGKQEKHFPPETQS